ncbi:MAG: hypothetical protein MJZ51_02150 [Bacteroidales bacterium]|nr:hypothetical protein [Bacteroidales bacterium]
MKRLILIAGLMLATTMASAQLYWSLPSIGKCKLDLNIDRLYDYNRYEENRLGAGLALSLPLSNKQQPTVGAIEGYFAYGTQDKAWKYGGEASLLFKNRSLYKLYLAAMHDVEDAAIRSLEYYGLLDLEYSSAYLLWRYSQVNRISLGANFKPNQKWDMELVARISNEQYLFYRDMMLLPGLPQADMPIMHFQELVGRLNGSHLKAEVMLGAMQSEYIFTGWDDHSYRNEESRLYARLLGQYYRSKPLGKHFELQLLGQLGATTATVPYSRMFDIGGCGGQSYFLKNTMLTVLPGEFAANNFVFINLHLRQSNPWWNTPYSAPKAFAQINALWGNKWSSGDYYSFIGNDFYNLNDNAVPADITMMMQPDKGVLEPAIGIENLLKARMLSMTLAAAYRITPKSAIYNRTEAASNLSLMLGAALSLDNLKL